MAEGLNSILSDIPDEPIERIENNCDKNLSEIFKVPFENYLVKKDYDTLSVSTYASSSCLDSQDNMSDLGNNGGAVNNIPTVPASNGSIGPVSVEGSSDILFGSKTFFSGPVVIKRFMVDNDQPSPTIPREHSDNNLLNVNETKLNAYVNVWCFEHRLILIVAIIASLVLIITTVAVVISNSRPEVSTAGASSKRTC